MSARPRRWEIATTGFDEFLQLVGGDPQGAQTSVGLRVPPLPTPSLALGGGQLRYLFLLASFSVGEGECVRIRGFRQLLTMGIAQGGSGGAKRVIEQRITSPFWHFPDGDVSWHITLCGGPNADSIPKGQTNPLDSNSFKQYWADAPALLYGPPGPNTVLNGGVYTSLTAYCPPNGGRPYGSSITSDHGTFYDIRSPWEGTRAWDSLDVPIRGPETVAFFASIRQTTGTTPAVVPPMTFYPQGLSPEEQFLLNFPATGSDPVIPGPKYWRVGGALIVEES